MTPKIVKTEEHASWASWADLGAEGPLTVPEIVKLQLHIPDTDPLLFAVWNGHLFELMPGRLTPYDEGVEISWLYPREPQEYIGHMYYPIDPRIRAVDVRNATVPYHNETGTAWLFKHCDEDAMIDYEKELKSAVVGEFAEILDAAQIKVNEATNSTVRAQAVAKHSALVAFRDAAVGGVVAWARTLHIGWQEQNPHEAHVHLPVLQAIQAVALTWQTDRTADWSKVSSPVAGIIKGLAKPHEYETRWDMKTRLDAEAAAREAAAEAGEGDQGA